MTMQALRILPSPHTFHDSNEFAFVSENFHRDFSFNLEIDHKDEKFEEEQEQQEFSFASANPQGSVVTADEIFRNGQIQPMLSDFDPSLLFAAAHGGEASMLRPPLKKIFVEQRLDVFSSDSKSQGETEGLLRELPCRETALKDPSGRYEKSNSTGSSKLGKYRRDLKLRSNSNGKDAFVFLNSPAPAMAATKPTATNDVVKKGNEGKRKTTSLSPHEKFYLTNRKKKENDKRRSFLPYNRQLVGFFASLNLFSKNVHPF